MKFGIREVTDIVFKTSVAGQQVGANTFTNKYTPVFIVDSAKMTSMENAVATVYAQGGKGNPRLLAWDGDRTATFKFDDALTSNDGLAILTGSGVITGPSFYIRQSHIFNAGSGTQATFAVPSITGGSFPGVNLATPSLPYSLIPIDDSGDLIPMGITGVTTALTLSGATTLGVSFAKAGATQATDGYVVSMGATPLASDVFLLTIGATTLIATGTYGGFGNTFSFGNNGVTTASTQKYLWNYYMRVAGTQLQVEAGKFAGYYYIEANTLFRDAEGVDHPAQITVPKGKIKSNFTLTMSPTGDPSTFSFEVDALPEYTRFDSTKKVLYTLDIMTAAAKDGNIL